MGVYTTGSGSSAQSFGFTWTKRAGFTTISDPAGMGTTTINGVNDHGDLVGFYIDSAGNTDGLLVTPGPSRPHQYGQHHDRQLELAERHVGAGNAGVRGLCRRTPAPSKRSRL